MQGPKSIRKQVFTGYMIMISIMVALVIIIAFCLTMISINYKKVARYKLNRESTQEAITSHYKWLDSLNTTLQNGDEFTGSLDPTQCALGKWVAATPEESIQDTEILNALAGLEIPHNEIHQSASEIIELSKTDSKAAFNQYVGVIKPKTAQVIQELTAITQRYSTLAEASSDRLDLFITLSLVLSILIALAAILFSLYYARRVSDKISKPIVAVAEWSKSLSMGNEKLEFSLDDINMDEDSEIGVMVHSFYKMASSIQSNVEVVRRVAQGDMTAFVDIRSNNDSLGKNLYKMVQSNDILFANILGIAQTVAEGSQQIAEDSHALSESTAVQAGAVQDLSTVIDYTNTLIESNTVLTKDAVSISNAVHMDAQQSKKKLDSLLVSMEEIKEASDRVALVIKTIDDIAFQTNILSLNAAVEAARAGQSGRGFAVVANEVRQLALNSAKAVTKSRELIEDTILKAEIGNKASVEVTKMFRNIVEEITQIAERINDINDSSMKQQEGIMQVRSGIDQILEAAATNACISQTSADHSKEMKENAELLRKAMSKFNLRKRQLGQAYIPPEKKDDLDFIRNANENYKNYVKTGKYGQM